MTAGNYPSFKSKSSKPKAAKGGWGETFKTIFYALLIAAVIRSLAFEPFHIPSGSMKQNLLVGDYLFVSKYAYGYSRYSFPFSPPLFKGRVMDKHKPQRGDVVLFRLPKDTSVVYIKRLMGLPGERIQVKNGIVYINGLPLPRIPSGEFVETENPFEQKVIPVYQEKLPEGKMITILKERSTQGEQNDTPEFTVPEGHYFMMGDNRDNSRDSRFMDEVGFVPAQNLVGRAEVIGFSTDGTGSLFLPWTWFTQLRMDRFFKRIE